MKPLMRGTSCSVAGRMGMGSVISRLSTRTLQSLRDTRDARQQRFKQVAVTAVRVAPALQQVDLHQVHRVDVGVAELDRALQGRVRVEQVAAVLDGEDMLPGRLVLGADVDEIVP